MKRKMVIVGIFYILGLFFASFFSNYSFLVIFLLSFCAFALMALIKVLTLKAALTSAVSFLVGVFIYSGYTGNYYTPVVSLAGSSTSFTGMVTEANEYTNDYHSYILKGEFENGSKASVLCFTDSIDCIYGDEVKVTGTFSIPEKSYLYDSTEYYKGMSVFLQADPECTYESFYTSGHTIVRKVQNYREIIQRRIYALSGRTGGSLTSAMLFGQRQGLDERIESAFYHVGIGPMLALSGFHLVLFNGLCNVFGRRTRLQRIMQLFMTVFMTGLFAVLSMWPVSVLRAGIMLLIARSACLFYRKSDSLSALFISTIMLTCTNPYLIHNVSFLLSVAGTFGINNFAPWITRKIPFEGFFGGTLKTSVYAILISLCTMPVCICYFSKISILSPISNVIFAPICVLIMFLGVVIFFLGGKGFICTLCGEGIKAVSELLTDGILWMQDHIPFYIPSGNESVSKMAFILAGMTLVVYILTKKRTMVFVSLMLSVAFLCTGQFILTKRFEQTMRIFVLGRSKGQVVVVTYNGRTDVIDYTYNNKNADHLSHFLDEYGINSVDFLYLTDNANAAAVSYDQKLSGVDVNNVLVTPGVYLGQDGEICKAIPVASDFCNITASSYEILADDERLTVTAYGNVVYFSKSNKVSCGEDYCGYIVTGGANTSAVFEFSQNDGVRQLCSGHNIELIMNENGKVYARRLY